MRTLLTWAFAVAVLCGWIACTSDDDYSLSPADRLSFGVDTVRFDTLFSETPSSTRSFWVYNHSKTGVRCTAVRLLHGGNGYRVLVDGIPLSELSGTSPAEIALRSNDSLRVYVELTAPRMEKNHPVAVEDELVFSLESGVEQHVPFKAFAWNAVKLNNFTVMRDTTFSAEMPIVVFGTLTVAPQATLRLPAGSRLFFHDKALLDVHGAMLCEGTAEQNVVLRGDRLDDIVGDIPYDRISGQWKGIRFRDSSFGNVWKFVDLHGATLGVVVDSTSSDRLKLRMEACSITNSKGNGITQKGARMELENTLVANTLGNCVECVGGQVSLNFCTLAQFYPFDARRGKALRFVPLQGRTATLRVGNSLITGYSDEEVSVEIPEKSVTYEVNFSHSVLRTSLPGKHGEITFDAVTWEKDLPKESKQGYEHFKTFDIQQLIYNFQLIKESAAVGRADSNAGVTTDRLGRPRDTNPDAGAFEYQQSR